VQRLLTYSWAVQNPLRLGLGLCNVDVPGDVCVAKTQTLHVAVMQSAEKRMRRYVDRNRGDRSMPTCRKVISPASTRLIAWPPCVCQDVHSPGGKSTTSCTCPWRILKLRCDRHLEQTAAMVPPRVVVKDGMGGRRLARSFSRSAATERLVPAPHLHGLLFNFDRAYCSTAPSRRRRCSRSP